MNRSEAAQALTVAAAYDNRSIGQTNVAAWTKALDDLRLSDVVDAIHAHYRDSSDFLQPAHIRKAVQQIRARRIDDAVIPAPPHELADDVQAALEWQRAVRKRIADGDPVEDVPGLVDRDVVKAITGTFRSVS